MPYKLRTFTCTGCGEQVERRGPPGSRVRCIHCAIRRSAEAARSMHAHSGEFYERWVDGMKRATWLGEQLAGLGAQIDRIGDPPPGFLHGGTPTPR